MDGVIPATTVTSLAAPDIKRGSGSMLLLSSHVLVLEIGCRIGGRLLDGSAFCPR